MKLCLHLLGSMLIRLSTEKLSGRRVAIHRSSQLQPMLGSAPSDLANLFFEQILSYKENKKDLVRLFQAYTQTHSGKEFKMDLLRKSIG